MVLTNPENTAEVLSDEDLTISGSAKELAGFSGDAKVAVYNLQSSGEGEALQATVNATENYRLTPEEREKKRREETALVEEMLRAQAEIRAANERINRLLDEYARMAEWYREQARKATEAMEKIATQMARNSDYVSEITDILESAGINGQFDREKARRLLAERGVKTDSNTSSAQLIKLLEEERKKAIENNSELSNRYEEQKRLRDRAETREEEIEQAARELRKQQQQINNNPHLTPSERTEKLNEQEQQHSAAVRDAAATLEKDKETQREMDRRLEETFLQQQTVQKGATDESADFSAAFDAITPPVGKQFAAAANPTSDHISSIENNFEKSVPDPKAKGWAYS